MMNHSDFLFKVTLVLCSLLLYVTCDVGTSDSGKGYNYDRPKVPFPPQPTTQYQKRPSSSPLRPLAPKNGYLPPNQPKPFQPSTSNFLSTQSPFTAQRITSSPYQTQRYQPSSYRPAISSRPTAAQSPKTNYIPPKASIPSTSPQKTYVPPVSSITPGPYSAPQSNQKYLPPSQSPRPQYVPPSRTYITPEQNYIAPSSSIRPQYNQPSKSYIAPTSRPSKTYLSPQENQKYLPPTINKPLSKKPSYNRPPSDNQQGYNYEGDESSQYNDAFRNQYDQIEPNHVHEPGMPFDFNYAVQDQEYSNDYLHNAKSDGDVTQGEYSVLLPDGRRQIVRYVADWKKGYMADISYEGEATYPDADANAANRNGAFSSNRQVNGYVY